VRKSNQKNRKGHKAEGRILAIMRALIARLIQLQPITFHVLGYHE